MVKKILVAILSMIFILSTFGCNKNETNLETYIGESMEEAEDYQLFPTIETSYVGDPMPYYEDGVFYIFYLEDLRDGKVGYHPWSLYETKNFYEYEHKGEVIPYADSIEKQDIALGTGSVIKDKEGVYHAFYTGHNDTYQPKEAIMHAISTDRLTWTKIPEDTFYADETYAKDDFRDPYVLYVEEENQYWMLITTRCGDEGVLAKYTSKDLKTWKDEGIFFKNDMGTDSNLECPSLIQYQNKWYLSFSDQWPDRQFHYRVSDSINGPFEKLEQELIDGNGFYAGRLETDGNHLYVFGWNGTKNRHSDSEPYNWAGNLVVHQLVQKDNGVLVPILNTSIEEKMNLKLQLEPVSMTDTVHRKKNNYKFTDKEYEAVAFKELLGSYRIECKIKDFKDSEGFGFVFNMGEDMTGALNVLFNIKNNKIEFYNSEHMNEKEFESNIDINFSDIEEMDISILVADSVVSMYVNQQCVLTSRMYMSQGMPWGIFGIHSKAQYVDMEIYK